MFASLFKRAQATIDKAIDQVVVGLVIATPFLIAAGFGTAALYLRLERAYGAETATFAMAGLFALTGLAMLFFFGRGGDMIEEQLSELGEMISTGAEDESADGKKQQQKMSGTDKELLVSALTSVALAALPKLLQLIGRNLPLIAVIIAALVVALAEARGGNGDDEPSADQGEEGERQAA